MLGGITAADELYIVTGYTDMRKSIDGLCAIVEDQLHMDPRRSALYLFCGKRWARVKALLWETDGLVLLYKRMEVKGRSRWPRSRQEVRQLTWQQVQKTQNFFEQKDLISQLNTTITVQTELIQSLKKDHEADREQIQNLLAQVHYLTKKLFGTSSEKMKDVEGQLNLFDEAEQETEVVNIYRETYKCPVCSTADAMAENIKFANAMPLYRQEQDWHQLGVDFTRAIIISPA